ncbi:hypothetical protein [Methanolapillus ohkumae]|uniref:Uncharacterized protein n=1 Tax=Methanolapillus ohkumae TaxID=3028298 RepID=A0AA96ZWI6_9EURY|nr:hypothetical protein MsAm2_16280 [Methanosarcinaceae archaeon Am2]
MNFLIYGVFLISLIPGIYFSTKKDFLVVFNEKYDVFWIKLVYTIPVFSMTTAFLSFSVYTFNPNYFVNLENITLFYGFLSMALSMTISLLLILIVNKFVIRNDEEIRIDNEIESREYVFYICCQYKKHYNFGGKTDGTKFSYPKRENRGLLIGIQMEDMIIDFKKLKGIDYALTYNGEIIVSEKALDVLHKYNLSGFQIRPVRNKKKNAIEKVKYFQLLATHLMPPVRPETEVYGTRYLMGDDVLVIDSVSYSQSDTMNALDFNLTFEYFGNDANKPYTPQRFWIITKKARDILILELNQDFDDFKPVILVDDEKKNDEKSGS